MTGISGKRRMGSIPLGNRPEERWEGLNIMNQFGYASGNEAGSDTQSVNGTDNRLVVSCQAQENQKEPIAAGGRKHIMEKSRRERELEAKNRELQNLIEKLEADVMDRNIELCEANRALERSNALQSEFIATTSHELRTPICAILSFSEFLKNDVLHPLTEKQKRFVSDIHNSGSHLFQFINDILDLAKIESGKAMLFYEKFSVQQALSEVESVLQPFSEKKNLLVIIQVADDVPEIWADKVKFKQILYNLLSNAIKFSYTGGDILVTARPLCDDIEPVAQPKDFRLPGIDFLKLSVTVSGTWIKPEDQERIFCEFESIDNLFSWHHKGTGLVLSLTRRLVEIHGGEIRMESEEENSSTFIVNLPLTKLIDEVSGLPDYRYFQYRLGREVSRAKRETSTFTVILVHLDDFSGYREIHGEYQADVCIRNIGEFLKRMIRRSDTVVRYRLDEFAIILPNIMKQIALVIAHKIQARIEDSSGGEAHAARRKLTATLAVVKHPKGGEAPEEILLKAHALMRKIKEYGGGRIEFHEHKTPIKNVGCRG